VRANIAIYSNSELRYSMTVVESKQPTEIKQEKKTRKIHKQKSTKYIPTIQRAMILQQTSALYKFCTYLLTYLLTYINQSDYI